MSVFAEGGRTKAYADYLQQCKEQGVEPASFRVFAETMDEYDREWEIAGFEYKREVKGKANELD